MVNDCLVTKLKGVVDNDSLLKLGEMVIKCSTAACGGTTTEAMRKISFSAHGAVVSAEGNAFKVDSLDDTVTEFTDDNVEHTYIFPDGEYNIHILNKYDFRGFGDHGMESSKFFSINVEDLAYSKNLRYLFTQRIGVYGELKQVDINNVEAINLNDYFSPENNKAFVNIDIFKDSTTLASLQVYGRWNSDDEQSYGNINNLKSPVLTGLLINFSKITGDVNTMIQNMIAAGRTSGNINIQGNDLITVNGTPFNEFLSSLPGSGVGVKFTIDLTAPNKWTAVRSA